MAQAIVISRFKCGNVYSLVIINFVLTIISLMGTFLWPVFTAWYWSWVIGYSHISSLIHRIMGFTPMVPDPYTDPPPEVFLTDGAHFENSSAFPLIRRKCPNIIALCTDPSRECSDIYFLMDFSRDQLECSWSLGPGNKVNVDPRDALLDFRLPRTRFIGLGWEPFTTSEEQYAREQACRQFMLGSLDRGSRWQSGVSKHLISHIRSHGGHTYMYFYSDTTLKTAFVMMPEMRKDMRVCQALDAGSEGLDEEDFLPTDVMHKETLRCSIEFCLTYSDGQKGKLYLLKGECSPEQVKKTREELAPYEPFDLPWTTVGKFPAHSVLTGGEGFFYKHVDVYAKYGEQMMQHAWDHGLKETLEHASEDRDPDAPAPVPDQYGSI